MPNYQIVTFSGLNSMGYSISKTHNFYLIYKTHCRNGRLFS